MEEHQIAYGETQLVASIDIVFPRLAGSHCSRVEYSVDLMNKDCPSLDL